jgi:class 3 adenylate cyclase
VPAVVGDAPPIAFLVGLSEQGTRVRLAIRDVAVTIGRDPSNQVCLSEDQLVSRFHCTIRVTGDGLVVEDLASSNGTYLGERRLGGPEPLPVPSVLTIGDTRLAVVPAPNPTMPVGTVVAPTVTPSGSLIMPAVNSFTVQNESLFVADIVDSTGLLARSEVDFANAILVLGQMIRQGLQGESEPFLQCTGDGFFACFRDASWALQIAARLGPGVARHVSPNIRISVALHWGATRNTGNGGKAGKDVYAVFSLDKVRHAVPAVEAASHAPGNETVVLMTEAFWSQLGPEQRSAATPVGAHELRAIDEPINIFHWRSLLPDDGAAVRDAAPVLDQPIPGGP